MVLVLLVPCRVMSLPSICVVCYFYSTQESKTRMTASVLKQDPHIKGSKERLFIGTQTHNLQICHANILASTGQKTTTKKVRLFRFSLFLLRRS